MNLEARIKDFWPFGESALRRVVIKVGSNVLALPQGGLNPERVEGICGAVGAAVGRGLEVIVVSSGAVAAGRGILGLTERPTSIPELQAVAAIGQGALVEAYARRFRREGRVVAQMLLNRDDLSDRRRYLNARNALCSLLARGVVPVINENDSVTIDELKFGDNDMLSAMVAAVMDADLLLILSDVAGLMTGPPERDPGARLVPVVEEITAEVEGLVGERGSTFGTGGMGSKIAAARHATQFGVAAAIVDGRRPGKITRVLEGDFEGTLFLPRRGRRAGAARRHWILSGRAKGTLMVDEGAERALVERGTSLLPVGVTGVEGVFQRGDIVRVRTAAGAALAQGLVNFSSEEMARIVRCKAEDVRRRVADADGPEAIHRNNLVLMALEGSRGR